MDQRYGINCDVFLYEVGLEVLIIRRSPVYYAVFVFVYFFFEGPTVRLGRDGTFGCIPLNASTALSEAIWTTFF